MFAGYVIQPPGAIPNLREIRNDVQQLALTLRP